MPVVSLPDGRKVQTGTVGALLVNIKTYDQLVRAISDDAKEQQLTKTQIQELEAKFKAALPVLKMVGMFDLFEPREWIENSPSPGRTRVGELFIEAEEAGEGDGSA